ncbi:hypothetical protein C8Q79DRAFT_1014369 [Trametes meyenii]|nr:hypothetical protein C8Q79DRAFT_1014369 [Trametes meyenii]
MSPVRSLVARRRRSSLAMGLTQVKPGNYGINPNPSPRALTFAPNVTPGTYVEADDDLAADASPPSPTTALFPPTAPPSSGPTRRRLPPGKRLSQGYIPRPPNAFMLFRANFVRQKHVPGSIETNHGSLSKIIGNCWRALPLEEKKYWEIEAKKAKAAHKERYPHYRFRPVHNKNKKKADAAAVAAADAEPFAEGSSRRKDKLPVLPAEEERCEAVAQFLLEGKKGEELAEAVRQLDMARALSRPESAASGPFAMNPFAQPPPQPQPQFQHAAALPTYLQRRPSSVPPPSTLFHPAHPIALPTIPFFAAPAPQLAFPPFHPSSNPAGFGTGTGTGMSASAHGSRAPSPVGNIARNRGFLGLRRASSCQPVPSERMWDGYDVYSAAPPHQSHQSQYQFQSHLQQQGQGQQHGGQEGQEHEHEHEGSPFGGFQLQPDNEPLPDVSDASIFQPGWTSAFKDAALPSSFDPHHQHQHPHQHALVYGPHDGAPHAHAHALSLSIGPLDSFDFASAHPAPPSVGADGYAAVSASAVALYEPVDPHAAWPAVESGPSSAFSGSPAHSDASLPSGSSSGTGAGAGTGGICAPQPQHALGMWAAQPQSQSQHQDQTQVQAMEGMDMGLGLDEQHLSEFAQELEKGYGYDVYGDVHVDLAMGFDAGVGVDMGLGMGVGVGGGDYAFCAAPEY